MVNPATWDDLATTDWDTLWTWDDPMANAALNAAFAMGTITRPGPSLILNWGGGPITEGLDSPYAKDTFLNPADAELNLVANSTFEAGITNWTGTGMTLAQSNVYAHGGTFSLRMTPDGVTVTPLALSDFMPVQPGSWYLFNGWIMSPTGFTVSVAVNWYTSGGVFISSIPITNAPLPGVGQNRNGYYKAPATATQAKIQVSETGTPSAANIVYLDDVTLTGINPAVSLGWPALKSGESWTLSAPTQAWNDGITGWLSVASLASYVYAYVAPPTVFTADFDLVTKVMTRELITGPGAAAAFLMGRVTDTNNHVRGRIDLNSDQTFNWLLETVTGGVITLAASGPIQGFKHTVAKYTWLRFQGIGSRLQVKVWPDGVMEPDEWDGVGTDAAWPTTPGGVGLGAFLYAGTTNALPVPFRFGRFFMGENASFPINDISVSSSLDDGMPSEVTDTQNIGISQVTGKIGAPQGQIPSRYYSTWRTDAPWSDFDRDTAAVVINSGAVAADGIRDTRLFTGQMADIPTDGSDATLKAVSRGRMRLSTMVQPPAVHGYYEGKEATWLASYALFKSGVYVAPPPNPGCRLYIPNHGTAHHFIPDTNGFDGFNFGYVVHNNAGLNSVFQVPRFVDGPFVAGMHSQVDSTTVSRWAYRNAKPLPLGPGEDFFSRTGSAGRVEFWLRGDPVDIAGSPEPTVAQMVNIYFPNAGATRWFWMGVNSSRQMFVSMNDGVSVYGFNGRSIPIDGRWHFVGFSWDIGGGKFDVNLDGAIDSYSTSPLQLINLELFDDCKAASIYSCMPISEFRLSSGTWSAPRGLWANAVPWTQGAVIRRSILTFDSIAQTGPREAYELLTSLARSELARTGFDDFDRFLYLPVSYWTEDEQQEVVEALSTDTNLGANFKPTQDVNKIYNQITVNFKSVVTEERWLSCYETSQLIQIPPKGSVLVEVSLSKPVIEMRGSTIAVIDGPTLAAMTGTDATHYITGNFAQDGTGSYAVPGDLVATIVSYTPGSAQVLLQSYSVGVLFIANNVNKPSLLLAAKGLAVTDSSVTKQDDDDVAVRGTRALDTSLPEVQGIVDAGMIAQELVSRLRAARTTITSSVWGDARRKPGQLVTISDTDNTQVSGPFRLSRVSTVQSGPGVDQVISAEPALPVMVWGQGVWGESLWGGG